MAHFNAPVEPGGYYFCGFAAVRENWRLGESFAMDGADGQVTLRSICHSEGVRNSSVDEGSLSLSRRIEKSPPVRGNLHAALCEVGTCVLLFFPPSPQKDLVASVNEKMHERRGLSMPRCTKVPREIDYRERKMGII